MLSENEIQKKTYSMIPQKFLEKAKLHRESRFIVVVKRKNKWNEELLGEQKCFKTGLC